MLREGSQYIEKSILLCWYFGDKRTDLSSRERALHVHSYLLLYFKVVNCAFIQVENIREIPCIKLPIARADILATDAHD